MFQPKLHIQDTQTFVVIQYSYHMSSSNGHDDGLSLINPYSISIVTNVSQEWLLLIRLLSVFCLTNHLFFLHLPNPNVIVAINKGMCAVKLCSNKMLQFLTGSDSKHRLTRIMAIKWLLLLLTIFFTAVLGTQQNLWRQL